MCQMVRYFVQVMRADASATRASRWIGFLDPVVGAAAADRPKWIIPTVHPKGWPELLVVVITELRSSLHLVSLGVDDFVISIGKLRLPLSVCYTNLVPLYTPSVGNLRFPPFSRSPAGKVSAETYARCPYVCRCLWLGPFLSKPPKGGYLGYWSFRLNCQWTIAQWFLQNQC